MSITEKIRTKSAFKQPSHTHVITLLCRGDKVAVLIDNTSTVIDAYAVTDDGVDYSPLIGMRAISLLWNKELTLEDEDVRFCIAINSTEVLLCGASVPGRDMVAIDVNGRNHKLHLTWHPDVYVALVEAAHGNRDTNTEEAASVIAKATDHTPSEAVWNQETV